MKHKGLIEESLLEVAGSCVRHIRATREQIAENVEALGCMADGHRGVEAKEARKRRHQKPYGRAQEMTPEQSEPDWTRSCEVCGEKPILPLTGMCGPCTFGDAEYRRICRIFRSITWEAETAGGDW